MISCQNLPTELERLLVRPDVSAHIARTFTSTVSPLVERQVKDTITKSLIPAYTQQSSAMHQELSREIHSEILNLKKEVITWQTEALRGQEVRVNMCFPYLNRLLTFSIGCNKRARTICSTSFRPSQIFEHECYLFERPVLYVSACPQFTCSLYLG